MPVGDRGGASRPKPPKARPKKPTRSDKLATIHSAEEALNPGLVMLAHKKQTEGYYDPQGSVWRKGTPPKKKWEPGVGPAPRKGPESIDHRYRVALASPVSPFRAGKRLAETMSPERRKQWLETHKPA